MIWRPQRQQNWADFVRQSSCKFKMVSNAQQLKETRESQACFSIHNTCQSSAKSQQKTELPTPSMHILADDSDTTPQIVSFWNKVIMCNHHLNNTVNLQKPKLGTEPLLSISLLSEFTNLFEDLQCRVHPLLCQFTTQMFDWTSQTNWIIRFGNHSIRGQIESWDATDTTWTIVCGTFTQSFSMLCCLSIQMVLSNGNKSLSKHMCNFVAASQQLKSANFCRMHCIFVSHHFSRELGQNVWCVTTKQNMTNTTHGEQCTRKNWSSAQSCLIEAVIWTNNIAVEFATMRKSGKSRQPWQASSLRGCTVLLIHKDYEKRGL